MNTTLAMTAIIAVINTVTEDDPELPLALNALADVYEEQGQDATAKGLRAILARERFTCPQMTDGRKYCWWTNNDNYKGGPFDQFIEGFIFTHLQGAGMTALEQQQNGLRRFYPDRMRAYLDLCQAISK